ncbi:hypothetical protein AK812_SmicGene22224 [Symbiodinium microadriaticum]|uniref:HEAT repeat domain-containing protein n=1 Tax=Symbiodinium microadriaticum TaxID=2951 RepID=A0A1Q9DKB6_SYMMI|nr:hypothetical protein AK812_SmicGene22224 [Symbiodinium microadriaticum]
MTEDFGYNSLWLEVQEAAAALFGFLDVSALTAARTTCQGQNVLAGVDRLFALQMRALETQKVAKDRRRALAAARRLVPPMQRVLLQRQAEVCLQSSEHRIVRTEAVRTLQEVVDPGDHAAAQALGTVVLDEDRFVRRALVDALVVHSADPQARSALHELAQDHDRFVQNAARHAISELGDVQSSELEAKMSRASGPPYVPRPPPGRTVVKTGRRFIGGSFRPQSQPVGLRAPPAQKVPPPRLWIEDANADTDCSETEVRTGRRLSAEYAVTVPEWADVPRAMAVSGDEFVSCHPVPGGVKLVLRRSGNPAREPSPDYTVADVQGTLEELEQEVPEVDEDQFDENQWMNDNRLQCLAEGLCWYCMCRSLPSIRSPPASCCTKTPGER